MKKTILAISSKSDIHRLILASALSMDEEIISISINGLSEDIEASARCVNELGATAIIEQENLIKITPIKITKSKPKLDFGECGTTARLFIPTTAALYKNAEYHGTGRLPERPFTELFMAMENNGCKFTSYKLPTEHNGIIQSGIYELEGNISSQYISALLFALPLLKENSEIRLISPLESIGYVNMTLDTLRKFGIKIKKEQNSFFITPSKYKPKSKHFIADGDWSNSAFWLASGAIGRNPITVNGLSLDSKQGDKEILNLLKSFGARVEIDGDEITVTRENLNGIEIDASEIPDLVPILSVIGAVSTGETNIINASRLRLKESDRITTTVALINDLGGEAYEKSDGIRIIGKPMLKGGECDGAKDHRIVMSAAIASIICENEVFIKGKEAANKSYQKFFEDFDSLKFFS